MKHNFRRLDIWVVAMDLVEKSYLVINELPVDERFGLRSQISRAAVSVASNIAEGSSRNSNKDFCRFLSMSIGSLYELETQLILLSRLFTINTESLIDICQNLQRMINGFQTKLSMNRTKS